MPKVDVPTVIKTVSGMTVLICVFSLYLWLATGFYIIYPPLSVLVAAVSVVFYGMGEVLRRQWTKR